MPKVSPKTGEPISTAAVIVSQAPEYAVWSASRATAHVARKEVQEEVKNPVAV